MGAFRVIIVTDRFDESVAFYSDAIGLPTVDDWDDVQGRGRIVRAFGDGCIELMDRGVPTGPITIGMEIGVPADVDAFATTLTSRGVEIADRPADQPWGHRNTAVIDPNGHRLIFWAPLTSSD